MTVKNKFFIGDKVYKIECQKINGEPIYSISSPELVRHIVANPEDPSKLLYYFGNINTNFPELEKSLYTREEAMEEIIKRNKITSCSVDNENITDHAISIVERYHKDIWLSRDKKLLKQLIKDIKHKLTMYQLNNLRNNPYILGLSGGLDSAIVLALCEGLKVIPYFIDIDNTILHLDYATHISKQYGFKNLEYIHIEDKNMSDILDVFINNELISDQQKIRIGNIKARLRMMLLYDFAKQYNGCVLSTDNLSEYNMGFWTLHGDVGDIAPIQFLNKGFELIYMAKELGIPHEIIHQKPSDGLGVTSENTDESQLGANYQYVDTVMFAMNAPRYSNKCLNIDNSEREVLSKFLNQPKSIKILDRYRGTEFKRSIIDLFQYRNNTDIPFKLTMI